MTTNFADKNQNKCTIERILKALSGKWKPQIFLLATQETLRFNSLMRQLEGINKQSLSVALREMEEDGFLVKEIIQEKPLHIEYSLSEKGRSVIPIFEQLDQFNSSRE